MTSSTSLDICNCAALHKAALVVAHQYEAAVAPTGLTLDEFMVLSKIGRLGDKSVTDLAGLLAVDSAIMAYRLKSMIARGLVTSTIGARDRRSRIIGLASRGRDLLAEATPLWAAANRRFEARLGPQKSDALRAVLGHIASHDIE